MTVAWDAGGDFAEVVDTLEDVTLRRPGCAEPTATRGWRFAEQTDALDGVDEAVTIVETTWQLPVGAGATDPKVGDRIIDSGGKCSTVYSVEPLRGSTRVRCLARRLVLATASADWFDLEYAIWDTQQSAQTPIDWVLAIPALRAIACRVAVGTGQDDPSIVEDRYRFVLTEPVHAVVGDRFRSRSGADFRVVSQTIDQQLGAGWSYDVVRAA